MEIGSEFHLDVVGTGSGLLIPTDNSALVFSGRTAIEIVLDNEKLIHKALLPSYCCDSMIEPFRKTGIEVVFYTVEYNGSFSINMKIDDDVDCILWCNYFGYTISMPDMSIFIKRGGIIIEDITHSFFSKEQFHEQSRYLVASLRKWEAVLCGGYCASRKGRLENIPQKKPAKSFIRLKQEAMKLKRSYLFEENAIEKSVFLRMFSEANEWLAEHYSGLSIDDYSKECIENVDYVEHQKKRFLNALVLYDGLKYHPDIEFMFDIENMDCPLFVPVIIKNGKRDVIRKKLIDNEIYCPVHWPHPDANCESNLYEMELSLVCDQRYGREDMQRIVDVLNK
jgi:hypothetical protein